MGLKATFAGKVRLYLEIWKGYQYLYPPLGDIEEAKLNSKMLKSSRMMGSHPVARR